MKKQSLDRISAIADVTALSAAPMSRRDRLRRWADLLTRAPSRCLRPLAMVEFYAESQRARLRGDETPIAYAFADPVLRHEGLNGDTLGDAEAFFGLNRHDTHRLLCDCRYHGRMDSRSVARRLRALADPNPLRRLLDLFRR